MTDLSPAQKAVAAFNERHELCGPFDDDWVEQCLAAALGKVTDQVVPYEKAPDLLAPYLERLAQRQETRRQLLAIAAELRGTTTTNQEG